MISFLFHIVTSISIFLNRGDDLFIKQEYLSAISMYQEHLRSNPEDAEALWRISRAYISIGDVAKREERESHYRKAETFATRSVRSDSLNSAAHTWRAVSLGYIAIYEGSRTKVKLCNEIKHELDLAIQLDAKNDVAYSIYGTFYRTLGKVNWFERALANTLLGGLPDGGFAEAEQSLKKAILLAPNIIRHRFELGMVYLEMGKPSEAKKIFSEAITLPILLASDKNRIDRMKRRLAEL
jgi:tetratricopeptide (TPR) repeat protein